MGPAWGRMVNLEPVHTGEGRGALQQMSPNAPWRAGDKGVPCPGGVTPLGGGERAGWIIVALGLAWL